MISRPGSNNSEVAYRRMLGRLSFLIRENRSDEASWAVWAFPVRWRGDELNRGAASVLLFPRRFPKRALSSRRRAVRERVTNRLAPIATLALPSHKGSFLRRVLRSGGL